MLAGTVPSWLQPAPSRDTSSCSRSAGSSTTKTKRSSSLPKPSCESLVTHSPPVTNDNSPTNTVSFCEALPTPPLTLPQPPFSRRLETSSTSSTPSLKQILTAYQTSGEGDRELLLALLSAKSAEDERSSAKDALRLAELSAARVSEAADATTRHMALYAMTPPDRHTPSITVEAQPQRGTREKAPKSQNTRLSKATRKGSPPSPPDGPISRS